MKQIELAQVKLWGARIGALHWDINKQLGFFEYDPAFLSSGIQIAPLTMPLKSGIYSFPALNTETFKGLPGVMADCLPDKFGNALIDAWLAQQGRDKRSFNPLERLCYIGRRAMGAMEFEPRIDRKKQSAAPLEVSRLVDLASDVLTHRNQLSTQFLDEQEESKQEALNQIIQVGTSAGGARAKAVVAWNQDTNEIRSGQVEVPPGFQHWLMKFDGVSNNRDKELADPQGFGLIEYAYSQMAKQAGIQMGECQLFEENGRSHFMIKRFDRIGNGNGDNDKLHMVTLCGIAHYDFNMAGAYSYEQAMETIQSLDLGKKPLEEFFLRMAFNVIARNQDDHTKNTAFLMDKKGNWSLSPAYDITFSYNPQGEWTSQHQMSINGKRDHFTREDLLAVARRFSIMKSRANEMIDRCLDAVKTWPACAESLKIHREFSQYIEKSHRLDI